MHQDILSKYISIEYCYYIIVLKFLSKNLKLMLQLLQHNIEHNFNKCIVHITFFQNCISFFEINVAPDQLASSEAS